MAQYAVVTDLNRCVGCLACSSACKTKNEVPIGEFWIKVLRVNNLVDETVRVGGDPCETYYLPMTCQHCTNPTCVAVCPTGASFKNDENGIVSVDTEACIGCQACIDACPYGVRSMNLETGVAETCCLCEELLEQGDLPQCVAQCSGRARWFGDLEGDLGDFEGPADPKNHAFTEGMDYETVRQARVKLRDYVVGYEDAEVHALPDEGTAPSYRYILRNRTFVGAGA